MKNYRQALDEVFQLEKIGGFHYTHQIKTLIENAKKARHWTSLLRTPPYQWRTVLRDTRYVLDQLEP
ncbi:hypothetical protein Lepto7375DRAFT_3177 [Leptolyngbya sp. PCC 7375]|nr:hypothetical protein Lepto7375DRAFT_3177 [Leptolyngbya sp. PCC 7375]